MLSIALMAASVLDRFSQALYRHAVAIILRAVGVRVEGTPLWVSPRIYLDAPRRGLISIGDRAVVSHYVRVLTHDFSMDRVAEAREGVSVRELSRRAPVSIGAGSFIGLGATLLPGVEVGNRAIVGAGSVVTKTVPPGTVVAGNPARIICSTDEYWQRRRDLFEWSDRRR